MKLWLLRPIEGLPKLTHHERRDAPQLNPWDPWYDKCFGLVIRAESEAIAREIAQQEGNSAMDVPGVWLTQSYSTCVELTAEGPQEVVITDVAHA